MALTQIADSVVPEVYSAYFQLRATQTNAFIRSGVAATDPAMTSFVRGGGDDFNLPFWNSIGEDGTEANISDDTENAATPDKVTAGRDIGQRQLRNNAWKAADVVDNLAGDDPIGSVISELMPYWNHQDNLGIINMIQGLIADNEANDGGDMVHDIYSDVASPAAANIISAAAVIQARLTSGDVGFAAYTNIAMHSITYGTLNEQNLIQYIPNSRAEVGFGSYQGLGVIVDDAMPVIGGTNSPAYWTVLFGQGAFRYGEGVAKVPLEIERQALEGQGGGTEILVSRRNMVMHPSGFQFSGAFGSVGGPSWAEMAAAGNWTRSVPRKLVRMAVLKHNNA